MLHHHCLEILNFIFEFVFVSMMGQGSTSQGSKPWLMVCSLCATFLGWVSPTCQTLGSVWLPFFFLASLLLQQPGHFVWKNRSSIAVVYPQWGGCTGHRHRKSQGWQVSSCITGCGKTMPVSTGAGSTTMCSICNSVGPFCPPPIQVLGGCNLFEAVGIQKGKNDLPIPAADPHLLFELRPANYEACTVLWLFDESLWMQCLLEYRGNVKS